MANSLAAVESGVRHIQGTINGLGERCGNANLMSIIPNLCLKKSFSDKYEINIKKDKLSSLTECSRLLDEILNRKPIKIWLMLVPQPFLTREVFTFQQ